MIDWRYWANNPVAIDCLAIAGWLYALLIGPWRNRIAPGQPFPAAAARRFYSGLALAYVAVGSPLARTGELYLFTAHLFQHLLILYPVAALFLSGLPAWLIDSAAGSPAIGPVLRAVTRPVPAGLFFILVVTAWHLPKPYEWALAHEWARLLQYALFLKAGIFFWWPLLSPSRIAPPIGYGQRLAYLFGIEAALTGVYTFILMADHAMVPTYEYAPRVLPGFSALNDQILAGMLLSGISSLVLLGALGFNFFRWASTDRAKSAHS